MANHYFIVRTTNRLTEAARLDSQSADDFASNNFGDVVEIRPATMSPFSTLKERRIFYFIRVQDIPPLKLETVKQRVLEKDEDASLDIPYPRRFGFGGENLTRPQVIARLVAAFPSWEDSLDNYFNATTVQPLAQIPTELWADIRAEFWNKREARAATQDEMET